MNRTKFVALAASAIALATLTLPGDPAPARSADGPAQKPGDELKKASLWMKQKLGASQKILAGLTEADYDTIEHQAEAMGIVSYLEKWVRADVPGYKEQMHVFEFANRELIRTAREKNLDGATLAFTQLTISCVNCHKIVRDVKERE